MANGAHGDEGDLGWTEDWAKGLWDPDSEADRYIMRLAREDHMVYMRIKLAVLWAEQRVGPDLGDHALRHPVEDVDAKRDAITAYLQDGGRLNDTPAFFDWPWVHVCRILSRGYPTRLLAMSEEEVDAFELAVRSGMGIRALDRTFRLGYSQTRNIVKMFREIL